MSSSVHLGSRATLRDQFSTRTAANPLPLRTDLSDRLWGPLTQTPHSQVLEAASSLQKQLVVRTTLPNTGGMGSVVAQLRSSVALATMLNADLPPSPSLQRIRPNTDPPHSSP